MEQLPLCQAKIAIIKMKLIQRDGLQLHVLLLVMIVKTEVQQL